MYWIAPYLHLIIKKKTASANRSGFMVHLTVLEANAQVQTACGVLIAATVLTGVSQP
jgi:hypothetical protein